MCNDRLDAIVARVSAACAGAYGTKFNHELIVNNEKIRKIHFVIVDYRSRSLTSVIVIGSWFYKEYFFVPYYYFGYFSF